MSVTAAGSPGSCASRSTILTSVRDNVSVRRHEDLSDGLRAVSHQSDDLAASDRSATAPRTKGSIDAESLAKQDIDASALRDKCYR
jgi:hypothetical protein